MSKITAPQMRLRLKSAGVDLDYCSNKVVSNKAGCRPIRWTAPGYDNSKDRALLNRIATAYNVSMPAQA